MIAFESGVFGAALRTAAEVGGGASGESQADESEVRGGTDVASNRGRDSEFIDT
jgi:hypothetical protein